MTIFDHGIRKIASASCTRIENIEIGFLAAVVNKFVGRDKVCTARSSAAITIAFIDAHILALRNRAAAFTVQKETGSTAVRLKIIIGSPCVSHSFTFLSIYE